MRLRVSRQTRINHFVNFWSCSQEFIYLPGIGATLQQRSCNVSKPRITRNKPKGPSMAPDEFCINLIFSPSSGVAGNYQAGNKVRKKLPIYLSQRCERAISRQPSLIGWLQSRRSKSIVLLTSRVVPGMGNICNGFNVGDFKCRIGWCVSIHTSQVCGVR